MTGFAGLPARKLHKVGLCLSVFFTAFPVPTTVCVPLLALNTSYWEEGKLNKGHKRKQRAGKRKGRKNWRLVHTKLGPVPDPLSEDVLLAGLQM